MGSLFRSEDMTLCQLYLQTESAYACMSKLGECGVMQFKDLNDNVNSFQKRFVNEVRRCGEMERQLNYFEKEMKKEEIEIFRPNINPEAPLPRDLIDLEATFESTEGQLKDVSNNIDALKANHIELTELKHVLRMAQFFFLESVEQIADIQEQEVAQSHMDIELLENPMSQSDSSHVRLEFLTGTMVRERLQGFMRLLWYSCHGNAFLKFVDLEKDADDAEDSAEPRKVIFSVFFQGEQLKTRVRKICEGYRATLYPCPSTGEERRDMIRGIRTRLEDLNTVIAKSQEQRLRILDSIKQNFHSWSIKVQKIKAIYHTMNMFHSEQRNFVAEGWCPVTEVENVQYALNKAAEDSRTTAPSFITPLPSKNLPTYNRTDKFSVAFQVIINAYGVSSYKEVNPAPFAMVTFPFLFSVMFGDMGHGLLLTLLAAWMVWKEKDLEKTASNSEMWTMLFGGRYLILLMGLFSIHSGFIYNDCFSKSVNIFGSSWTPIYELDLVKANEKLELDAADNRSYSGSPYPFGLDPVWQMAENKIEYTNSYKKKLSVIIGICHMLLGICLSVANHKHFRKPLNLFCEFIPQMIFILSLFGYLVVLLFAKWVAFDASSKCPPSLLIGFINMFLMSYPTSPCSHRTWYSGQQSLQTGLVLLAVICIPWILLVKPLILRQQHKPKRQLKTFVHLENDLSGESTTDEASSPDPVLPSGNSMEESEEEPFDFGEVFTEQAIHTIEYCLNCVSHTASYLRLWALSLAHAQLSEVLWEMVLHIGFSMDGYIGAPMLAVVFVPWAVLTIAILLFMEGLSAFLHTLRLHWVEFQSKFYQGQGFPFVPFDFKELLKERPE